MEAWLLCRLGVLVEVNCETDFVARGDTFKELVQDIAMQIAASPGVDIVSIEEAPQEELERERALEMQKEDIQSKPENIRCTPIAQGTSCASTHSVLLLDSQMKLAHCSPPIMSALLYVFNKPADGYTLLVP